MLLYVLRRLALGVVLALLVTLVTFLLLSFSFEDVVRTILGQSATPDTVDALMAEKGYDRPLIVQYGEWLGGAFTGDFGDSAYTSVSVAPTVVQRLGVTMSVIIPALLIMVVVSVALGLWSAARGGVADRVAQLISLIGYVVPPLLLAIVLVYVLGVRLKWLPATGFTEFGDDPAAWARSVTIPVTVLVIGGIANMTAQVRGRMIDELRRDYIRTLRTRGVSTRSILLRHALRNAASPALTVLSLEFIQIFGSALIIENVFALPGFGSYAFNASLQGDIPIIMCVTTFGVLLVIAVNLITDLANGWLNPKARVH
ncbi:ABC transporter permease [Parafrankia soli]|uniref:ABC transporter permease n=1 Tax=Parafrankia soli TaxID=2599596 RepID=A0A1S1PEL3_9ACTN|nr:ABC transporter permease [Parafrankia soli]OHV21343.1 ABC transporter permease [Parafrankia soli]